MSIARRLLTVQKIVLSGIQRMQPIIVDFLQLVVEVQVLLLKAQLIKNMHGMGTRKERK